MVAEIEAAGGKAIANGSSVSDRAGAEKLIQDAIDAFGRVDILINNAGILRDRTFKKMTLDDFHLVVDVHLMGTVYCTHFAWEKMLAQGYGRIVNTTSSSGLFGNFGQANYGAARMGVVGLMNVLKLEGQKSNVHVNTIAPTAGTRMTEDLMPKEVLDMLTPESVTAGLLTICHDDAPNRYILCAGAGGYASTRLFETDGIFLPADEQTPENIVANMAEVSDTSNQSAMETGAGQTQKFLGKAMAYMQNKNAE